MNELKCKRIYEPTVETDGFRILVDKLWPRGIKKENAKLIYGLRRSLHQMNSGNGFPILLKNMMNLIKGTNRNCPAIQHHRNLKICVGRR